jgi:hypothetical protein
MTHANPALAHSAMPRALAPAAVLITIGVVLVAASFRASDLASGASAQLPLYCTGLIFIGALTWWEATRSRRGVLPAWTSPPALIAGWSLAWIYGPALAALLDSDLLDVATLGLGGETVLLTGLPLTCVALAILSMSYHATTLVLGSRVRAVDQSERHVPLRRMLALYFVGTLARALRLQTLGMGFGAELASWGPLRSLDQWIGYLDDLRLLALALLVAHVVRRRTGYSWLAILLILEIGLGVSSGFLTPVIMPIALCVVTSAAVGRLRFRHFALVVAAALAISTFIPVIAAIRDDRMGAIGTTDLVKVGDVLTAPGRYWLAGVSSGDGIYDKFFGRQAEVASATGLVVTLTPAVVPYEGLERFLTLPAALIPRAIWPDKPTLSRGVWFSSTFRGLDLDTTSYSAMTIFSEGFLFYGWIGTVLGMVMAGVLLAVVRRRLDNPRLVFVYLALVPTILQIEPELSSYLTMLIQRSVVFVVAFLVLSHINTAGVAHPRVHA